MHEYAEFERSVRSRFRYIHNAETRNFLSAVIATSGTRTEALQVGATLWRSQIGFDPMETVDEHGVEYDYACAFQTERMKPNVKFAGSGRANCRGIPCLYLEAAEVVNCTLCETKAVAYKFERRGEQELRSVG